MAQDHVGSQSGEKGANSVQQLSLCGAHLLIAYLFAVVMSLTLGQLGYVVRYSVLCGAPWCSEIKCVAVF